MSNKTLFFALAGMALAFSARADVPPSFEEYRSNMKERYQSFRNQKLTEFQQFRNRINEEYAEFMRGNWISHDIEKAEPVPPSPEPPVPPQADPQESPSNDELPVAVVKPLPQPTPPPMPLLPDAEIPTRVTPQGTPTLGQIPRPAVPEPQCNPEMSVPAGESVNFDFYGSTFSVPFDPSLRLSLPRADEAAVADGWMQLSADESMPTLKALLQIREDRQLCDWAYIFLTDRFADAVFPDKKNEATLLKMFLLTQSGYKVRIGKSDLGLMMLIPSNETLYNYRFLRIGGEKYYIYEDQDKSLGSINIFDREFPREQFFSVGMFEQPQLEVLPAERRTLQSKRNPEAKMEVVVNRNLIDFYNDYPEHSNWELDVVASLSGAAKEQMYPALRKAIEGKTVPEAANVLLQFVQTAFEYMTDEEQFGYERPLFPDETLYYPYCDCEDRSILYAVLVRDLLGLEIVLLHYPGHLATAVCFDEDVAGDHFMVDGKKYVVCDPTFINARIGKAMKQYKGVQAEIVKI